MVRGAALSVRACPAPVPASPARESRPSPAGLMLEDKPSPAASGSAGVKATWSRARG
jgi:hypothetical protein